MAQLFLSYAREDRECAELFARALSSRGWTVWWDRRIQVGRSFSEVIEHELEVAQCVIVLWSRHSVMSDWVQSEAAEAARRRVLVPVRIEDVRPPLEFRRLHTADLLEWRSGFESPDFDECLASIEMLAPRIAADPTLAQPAPQPERAANRIRGRDVAHLRSVWHKETIARIATPPVVAVASPQSINEPVVADDTSVREPVHARGPFTSAAWSGTNPRRFRVAFAVAGVGIVLLLIIVGAATYKPPESVIADTAVTGISAVDTVGTEATTETIETAGTLGTTVTAEATTPDDWSTTDTSATTEMWSTTDTSATTEMWSTTDTSATTETWSTTDTMATETSATTDTGHSVATSISLRNACASETIYVAICYVDRTRTWVSHGWYKLTPFETRTDLAQAYGPHVYFTGRGAPCVGRVRKTIPTRPRCRST